MQTYEITLIELNTQYPFSVQVEVDEAETTGDITIFARVGNHKFESASDAYLPAFQEFRDKLLTAGYGIKCNGSRINAVQSGMMEATDKVYLIEMGRQALTKDIVPIWDYADLDIFPNTEQQKKFFKQWTAKR